MRISVFLRQLRIALPLVTIKQGSEVPYGQAVEFYANGNTDKDQNGNIKKEMTAGGSLATKKRIAGVWETLEEVG